jgi:hypothetical protein
MIIGLCGLAGSGKSHVAKALVRNYGYVRRPFAYPLKRMAGSILPPHLADFLDGSNAEKEAPRAELGGKSIRFLLQTLGTEWGRVQMHQDFWVDMWMQGRTHFDHAVADDVRFINEERAIRQLGGVLVRVDRLGAGSKSGGAHSSENVHLLKPDYIIQNDGDLDDLEDAVAQLVEGVHGREKVCA